MRGTFKILLLLFLHAAAYAQNAGSVAVAVATSTDPYTEVDRRMSQQNDSLRSMSDIAKFITANFTSDEHKARAIFYWITRNVAYSADLMYTYTTNNNRSRLAKEAFENRLAVCIGYTALFDSLCRLTSLPSYIVEGSTRQSFLSSVIGHTWNAIRINGEWRLVDPTWGSGSLNGTTFMRHRTDFYFLPDPYKLIKTHLPIDPIWQLLSYPVTLAQFYSRSNSTVSSPWNYKDSITAFLASPLIAQYKSTARRLDAFGVNSEITSNYYNYLQSKQNEYYNTRFNKAVKESYDAVRMFNEYIEFRNNQFTPARSDDELKKIMPTVGGHVSRARQIYAEIESQIKDDSFRELINDNHRQLAELDERVKNETDFVDKYIATPKNKRRDLFYIKRPYPFGVPVK